MATNSAGSIARQPVEQVIAFLRKTITYTNTSGTAVYVGTIPAGSLIVRPMSGHHVVTAFNAGTTNTIDIGTSGTSGAFSSAQALGSAGFVVASVNSGVFRVANDTAIYATPTMSGTAATAGEAEVIIAFITDTDG